MVKKQLILMNGENKVLVFMQNRYLYFPSLSPTVIRRELPLRDYVLGAKGFDADWLLVEEIKKKQLCFYAENNHLCTYNKLIEKEYYMKKEDLSKEQIRGIMKYCYKNGVLPDLFTVEELLQIVGDETLNISYEEGLPKVLKKIRAKKKRK